MRHHFQIALPVDQAVFAQSSEPVAAKALILAVAV